MPDTAIPKSSRRFSRKKALRLFFPLFLLFAVGFAAYQASERYGLRNLRTEASHQLDLLAAAIDSEVTRHAHIPGAVGLSPEVIGLLNASPGEQSTARLAANRYLEKLNAHIDGLSVFVLDLQGRVVASSDWIYTDNVLGADFSHRPFFRAASIGTPIGNMRTMSCGMSRDISLRTRFVMSGRTGRLLALLSSRVALPDWNGAGWRKMRRR